MQEHGGYGQYCPLSMAAEILCNRWTVLVLRRLLEGSTGFNEIRRGVPLISRTILAQRLKEFESYGLVSRDSEGAGKPVVYRLTQAGMALGEVVRAIATWGQEWIDVEPSLADDRASTTGNRRSMHDGGRGHAEGTSAAMDFAQA